MRKLLFVLLFICGWGISGWGRQETYSHGDFCIRALAEPPPRVFRVVTFNTQNLHIRLRSFNDDKNGPGAKAYTSDFDHLSRRDFRDVQEFERDDYHKNARYAKSHEQIQRLADSLLEVDPDIAVLQEVDSIRELEHLNKHHFKNQYATYLIDGNDRRGFEIGFLVRKGVDIDVEFVSHKELRWTDPVAGVDQPLFSRDAPALIIRRGGEQKPLFIVIGHHAKSKAPSPLERAGPRLRTAQHNALAAIVTGFQDEYGEDVPILVAGDYNTDIHKTDETESLRSIMHDVFDVTEKPLTEYERITHSTFVEDKRGSYGQYDGILMTRDGRARVQRAGVQRDVARLARSQKERNKQISDHFLVYADIELLQ